MAYIFGGAALIALSVYVVLVGSEMLLEPGSKPGRAKLPQPARRAPVTEETLVLSPAETPILAAPGRLGEEAGCVTAPPHGAQIPMTVPANLESEPTWT